MRPKTKKKDPLEDAVGTPKSTKKTNKAFTRKPRAAKATSPVSKKVSPAPDEQILRVRNGVSIPMYPSELITDSGERHPAVVKWYRDNHPKAFDALYSGRTIEE